MQRQADAMIADPILWEIVRTNLLRSIAGADLASPLRGDLLVLFILFHLVQPSTKHAHGLRAILDLRLLVLLRHDQARREIGDAHGGVSRIHGLPARTRGTKRIDAEIFGLDLDVDFIGLWQHRYSRG